MIIYDDFEKSTISHKVLACLKQYLHNTKREDLTKSTGVVPAKYPSKVKLELLTTLECQSQGQLYVPWLVRVLGLLQQYRVDLFSLVLKSFPYKSRILRNTFLVGVFLNMRHKIFSCIYMRGGQVMLEPSISCLSFNLMSSASHLCPRLMPLTPQLCQSKLTDYGVDLLFISFLFVQERENHLWAVP